MVGEIRAIALCILLCRDKMVPEKEKKGSEEAEMDDLKRNTVEKEVKIDD